MGEKYAILRGEILLPENNIVIFPGGNSGSGKSEPFFRGEFLVADNHSRFFRGGGGGEGRKMGI